jgi:type VI secretion system protein ImpH
MAANRRETAVTLSRVLRQNSRSFSFFKLVEMLEAAVPGSAPVGYQGPIEQEVLRFRPNASLGFPSGDVESIEAVSTTEGDRLPCFQMTVNFLGLYGPASPLPAFYTEDILGAADAAECSRRDFLDVFHHRLISLFYRCWKKYRYYALYQLGAQDLFSQRIFALLGLRDPQVRRFAELNWVRLLPFAGLLSMRSRSATTIAMVLSSYFEGLPVQVRQFIRRWVVIHESQRAYLGRQGCTLGEDLTLGARVADCAGKFRLALGPLGFADFLTYLPQGVRHRPLRELVQFMLSEQLAFDIELQLRSEEVPPLRLGAESPCRLGWSIWLGAPSPERPATVLLQS